MYKDYVPQCKSIEDMIKKAEERGWIIERTVCNAHDIKNIVENLNYISIRVRKKVNGISYYTTFGVPKKIKVIQ